MRALHAAWNPIIQQFSNDASTLIPRQALGTDYIISGYETANPKRGIGFGGATNIVNPPG
jgi:hypothetical protein